MIISSFVNLLLLFLVSITQNYINYGLNHNLIPHVLNIAMSYLVLRIRCNVRSLSICLLNDGVTSIGSHVEFQLGKDRDSVEAMSSFNILYKELRKRNQSFWPNVPIPKTKPFLSTSHRASISFLSFFDLCEFWLSILSHFSSKDSLRSVQFH